MIKNNKNYNNIKENMLMILNSWNFVTISGNDADSYLQNQLTSDIYQLTTTEHILTAHCNAKGKVWSTLRLFHYNDGYGYILRKSVTKQQITEFKKYATFSKITIKHLTNIILLGMIKNTFNNNILQIYFPQLPNQHHSIMHYNNMSILYFNLPIERFLLIINKKNFDILNKNYNVYGNSDDWLAMDIAAGIPNIDIENTATFIPQSINLEHIHNNSINFQKGCYMGQEIISRIKYHNSNKRNMYWLIGTGSYLPKIGDKIEWKENNNNWCNVGIILSAIKLTNGNISMQVILNNNISNRNNQFRLINDQNSILKIQK